MREKRINDDTTQLFSAEDLLGEERSSAGRRASLVVIAGWEIGREIELNCDGAPHTIGRSPDATTPINEPSISRQHAAITHIQEGGEDVFEIADLGSRNGVLVNNVRVNKARLKDDDKILLGSILFKFVLRDAVDSHFYRRIHELIHFDQLTGLMTMDSFRRTLEDEIKSARQDSSVFSLAMTDLDGLKKVNDTYGHLAGRKTIREMGALIRETLRPGDRGGLYGGDEAILLFKGARLDEAVGVAEALRAAIESFGFNYQGQAYRVTISQGLAEWPRHGVTAEEIIAAADAALYAAKKDGRNCVRTAHG